MGNLQIWGKDCHFFNLEHLDSRLDIYPMVLYGMSDLPLLDDNKINKV